MTNLTKLCAGIARISVCSSIFFCMSLSAGAHDSYQGISEKNPTGSYAISAEGLVAAYDFETRTKDGALRDFSPSGNHGKLAAQKAVAGQYGGALAFKTVEDVISLPDNATLDLMGPITVAAKLKVSTSGLHQHLFVCSDLFVLWLTGRDSYRFADTIGNGITTNQPIKAVQNGGWHSVVAVLSASKGDALTNDTIKLFVDGVQMESTLGKTWTPAEKKPVRACAIGGDLNGAQSHQDLQFEGVVDELQIFSRALSDEEVRAYSR